LVSGTIIGTRCCLMTIITLLGFRIHINYLINKQTKVNIYSFKVYKKCWSKGKSGLTREWHKLKICDSSNYVFCNQHQVFHIFWFPVLTTKLFLKWLFIIFKKYICEHYHPYGESHYCKAGAKSLWGILKTKYSWDIHDLYKCGRYTFGTDKN
jgi:hypothetical protein